MLKKKYERKYRRNSLNIRLIYLIPSLVIFSYYFFNYNSASRNLIFFTKIFSYPPFNEKFSVIYPTHSKRVSTLQKQIARIAHGQSKYIDSIFIYWIDKNASIPPPPLSRFVDLTKKHVRVEVLNSEQRKFTDRFIKPKNLTTRVVLSSDDDVNLPAEIFDRLFEIYLTNNLRNHMFGILPRNCYNNRYVPYKWYYFNMVLTNFCFLDVSMLDLYQLPKYQELRDWVNERFNGEDILMNYIVQDNYKTPPVSVRYEYQGGPSALSHRAQHDQQRSEACETFNNFFKYEVPRYHATKFSYDINATLLNIVDPDYF